MATVTVNTAELEGAPLDWAVAKAIGETNHIESRWYDEENGAAKIAVWCSRQFSSDWSQGGPLIAEKVTVTVDTENGFYADCGAQAHAVKHQKPLDEYDGSGPTILIACCRAIVASELGDIVEIPEELVK